MADVLIYSLSTELTKALGDNSQSPVFAGFDPTPPVVTGAGVFESGAGGILCAPRLFILPYCEGPAGAAFSFRVYGWRGVLHGEGTRALAVDIPYLLGEFACVACNRSGPPSPTPGGPSPALIRETERFCDTITLTQGNLGNKGFVNSTGPGTDLIASIMIDLTGCRKFQFDFQQTDPVSMNLLWAKA